MTKLSTYCKIYPSKDDPDNSYILFSTKNAAKISVPASIIRDIENQHLSENEQTTASETWIYCR